MTFEQMLVNHLSSFQYLFFCNLGQIVKETLSFARTENAYPSNIFATALLTVRTMKSTALVRILLALSVPSDLPHCFYNLAKLEIQSLCSASRKRKIDSKA